MTLSIVIPTWRAGKCLSDLLDLLKSQYLKPAEIIVIDSSSDDNTCAIASNAGCKVKIIPKEAFNHGASRNLGARLARGEFLIFMTQDALPASKTWLEALVAPLISGEAAATYGRQLPRPDSKPLEVFARSFNYPPRSQLRSAADIEALGIKAFFFSNVCSAVKADVFWQLGGFPEGTLVNEDMLFAAKLLRAGHKIKYIAEAQVFHAHDYSLKQQFGRNFDIGVFFSQSGEMLAGAKLGGTGFRFALGQIVHVTRIGKWWLIPQVIAETGVKFTAFQLGRRERTLPRWLKKRLSRHGFYWERRG